MLLCTNFLLERCCFPFSSPGWPNLWCYGHFSLYWSVVNKVKEEKLSFERVKKVYYLPKNFKYISHKKFCSLDAKPFLKKSVTLYGTPIPGCHRYFDTRCMWINVFEKSLSVWLISVKLNALITAQNDYFIVANIEFHCNSRLRFVWGGANFPRTV